MLKVLRVFYLWSAVIWYSTLWNNDYVLEIERRKWWNFGFLQFRNGNDTMVKNVYVEITSSSEYLNNQLMASNAQYLMTRIFYF